MPKLTNRGSRAIQELDLLMAKTDEVFRMGNDLDTYEEVKRTPGAVGRIAGGFKSLMSARLEFSIAKSAIYDWLLGNNAGGDKEVSEKDTDAMNRARLLRIASAAARMNVGDAENELKGYANADLRPRTRRFYGAAREALTTARQACDELYKEAYADEVAATQQSGKEVEAQTEKNGRTWNRHLQAANSMLGEHKEDASEKAAERVSLSAVFGGDKNGGISSEEEEGAKRAIGQANRLLSDAGTPLIAANEALGGNWLAKMRAARAVQHIRDAMQSVARAKSALNDCSYGNKEAPERPMLPSGRYADVYPGRLKERDA